MRFRDWWPLAGGLMFFGLLCWLAVEGRDDWVRFVLVAGGLAAAFLLGARYAGRRRAR